MTCKTWHEIGDEEHCNNGQHCVSVDAECNSIFRNDEHTMLCCCCGKIINPRNRRIKEITGFSPEEWIEKVNDALNVKWYAQPNDLIGGWCVSIIDKPPSQGPGDIGNFITEEMARHVVEIHNNWLHVKVIKNELEKLELEKSPCGCSEVSLSGRFVHESACKHVNFKQADEETEEPYTWDSFKSE
jgi:hypothetical protein